VDIVDKFYLICELFDDDLYAVSLELKKNGVKGRPSKVMKNISNLFLDKYIIQIDTMYLQRINNEPTITTQQD